MSDTLIKVDGVSKKFCRSLKKSLWYGMQDLSNEILGRRHGGDGSLRPDEFWAVDGVSFELKRGECLGLIGRNGAGKTTLLKMLNGLIKPDKGRIEMRGRVGALIALGAGFNPILTGRENIYVNGAVLGLGKREIDAKLDEIIDFAEIVEFIDSPVQNYSSGMQVRLGFAVATALDPDILLLDEVLAVGDVAFRSKCFQRIGKLLQRCAVIFVSHDQAQVLRICDYCIYLKNGQDTASGPPEEVLFRYGEDSRTAVGEEEVFLHPDVTSFSCNLKDTAVNWGDSIEVTIDLHLKSDLAVGVALLALLDGEISVLQTEFTDLVPSPPSAVRRIAVSVGPLHLRGGVYSVAVTLLDESRKMSLVHAVNCAVVNIKGDRGYGTVYQAASSPIKAHD